MPATFSPPVAELLEYGFDLLLGVFRREVGELLSPGRVDAPGQLGEYPDLGARLAWRVRRLLLQLDVGVQRRGAHVGLLVPGAAGQHDVGVLDRGGVQEVAGHDKLELAALHAFA